MVSIAVAIAASPHSALAQGDKSTSNLFKHTATGKHYNNTTLIKPNSTGAGTGTAPKLTPDKVGVKNISR